VAPDALAVGLHHGARSAGGVLDGWLVADEDADAVLALEAAGIRAAAAPLWLTPGGPAAQVARDALALAARIR